MAEDNKGKTGKDVNTLKGSNGSEPLLELCKPVEKFQEKRM